MDGDGGRDGDDGRDGDGNGEGTSAGEDPGAAEAARRRRFVGAIMEARRDDVAVTFVATSQHSGDVDPAHLSPRVEYEDADVRLELDDGERSRLEELLEEYRVFKIDGPVTRKAPDGVVHVSAVTDAKHAADFVESLFREVYGLDEGYDVRVE